MKRLLIAGGAALVLFVALVAVTVMLPESPERMPYSTTNPRSTGTRAVAQVLSANGVSVTQVMSLTQAAAAPAGSTLVVVLTDDLNDAAITRLARTQADLVIVYPGDRELTTVPALAEHRVELTEWWSYDPPTAKCTDPDALAAGTITPDGSWALEAQPGRVTTCFTNDYDAALYADMAGTAHRITIVTGSTWLQNGTITKEGNAALALRVFGRHARVTWYLPGADALATATSGADQGFDYFVLLPPWSRPVFALLLAAGVAAALWRGRRFGALVSEAMPVEIPASEVSSGLAGLYRQGGALGHAAAALRAAAIMRVAARLGLPTSAEPATVVNRIAEAGGADPTALRTLLYGPPPATDQELADLAHTLTDLDRKLSSR